MLEIDSIIDLLDKESFLSFAKNIYIETHKETSAIVYSLYRGDEALREIYKKEKDSNFFLIILSSVKTTEYSIKLLYDIYSKTKKSELREEAFYLINNKISKKIGLDIDDLELKFSLNFGFDVKGEKIICLNKKIILKPHPLLFIACFEILVKIIFIACLEMLTPAQVFSLFCMQPTHG